MKYLDSWEVTEGQIKIGLDVAVTRSVQVIIIGWASYNRKTCIWYA